MLGLALSMRRGNEGSWWEEREDDEFSAWGLEGLEDCASPALELLL
jgi:hypothetical protein